MANVTGLGKGLSSLIPPKIDRNIFSKNSQVVGDEEMVVQIPVEKIGVNPMQPRSDFDHDSMEDLTNSIKEQQKLELALVENIQRKDLNPIEESVAYHRLIDEFSLTQEEVAKKVGKSRSVVANTIRLLTLPTEIQKALINGKINYSVARVIVGLPVEERMKFFQKVISQDLTVRAVENQAKKISIKQHFRKSKDPNLTALEDKLQASLGTKVIVKKSGDGGQIIIEFYSSEELENLINKITI